MTALYCLSSSTATATDEENLRMSSEYADIPTAGIHPWLKAGERLDASISLDNAAPLAFQYHAEHDGMLRHPAFRFHIPPKTQVLRLRGTLSGNKGNSVAFDETWCLLDMAPYTEMLYRPGLGLMERIQKLNERLTALMHESDHDYINPIRLERQPAPVEADLQAVEARYDVQLPAVLRSLMEYTIEIDDSYFVKPAGLKSVEETLLTDWGYREDGEHSIAYLPEALRKRYQRSLVVFVEVGDGMGALAWDPLAAMPGEPSNIWVDQHSAGVQSTAADAGVWFWVHEETLAKPELLLDEQFRPLDADKALLNPFQRFAFNNIEEFLAWPSEDRYPPLIIDTAHPHGFLQLHFAESAKLWLRSYDYHYSLL